MNAFEKLFVADTLKREGWETLCAMCESCETEHEWYEAYSKLLSLCHDDVVDSKPIVFATETLQRAKTVGWSLKHASGRYKTQWLINKELS